MSRLRDRDLQSGQAIVLVALAMVVLLGFAALAVDAGLGQSDRRDLQTFADNAALAGARSLRSGTNAANYVALQYLGPTVGYTMPVGSCASTSNCPPGRYVINSSWTVWVLDNQAAMSGASETALDVNIQFSRASFFGPVLGRNALVSTAAARAVPPGPVWNSASYSVATLGGDYLIDGGGNKGAPSGDVSGPVYTAGGFGGNNGPHAVNIPTVQYNYDGTACPGSPSNHLDTGGTSNTNSNVNWTPSGPGTTNGSIASPVNAFTNNQPTVPSGAQTYSAAAQAKDGSGHWKPGIYNGFVPDSGATLNGGVYKIINVASPSLTGLKQTTTSADGTADAAGAVAFILDNSDSGTLSLANSTLNGLDDLSSAGSGGTHDPLGTHNFVIWSSSGSSAFTGGFSLGQGSDSTDLSGIIYLPKSDGTWGGNVTVTITGSMYVNSYTGHGGGHATQVVKWVCNLSAVAGPATQGGLIR